MRAKLQRSIALLALLTLALCGEVLAMHHNGTAQRSRTSKRNFRRVRWNPMFRPSHDSLLRQNEEIDRQELPRIADDEELEQLKASEELVPIRESEFLRFDPRLDPTRRYCRPWTREFVEDLSQAYYRQFHSQIQVNSAVRTVKVQRKLRRRNRNAAPEKGETASSHLAGITLDLQRRGMSKAQVHFVESYLFYLKALGLVEPEEERRQWVFHVMVSYRYSDWRQNQTIFPTQHPVDAALTRAE
ncbi:MAG TPA: DUF5715 family protein [Terriglobales bacterium]|nr:DUF5715 family protein [Terriglobales bacterium]